MNKEKVKMDILGHKEKVRMDLFGNFQTKKRKETKLSCHMWVGEIWKVRECKSTKFVFKNSRYFICLT